VSGVCFVRMVCNQQRRHTQQYGAVMTSSNVSRDALAVCDSKLARAGCMQPQSPERANRLARWEASLVRNARNACVSSGFQDNDTQSSEDSESSVVRECFMQPQTPQRVNRFARWEAHLVHSTRNAVRRGRVSRRSIGSTIRRALSTSTEVLEDTSLQTTIAVGGMRATLSSKTDEDSTERTVVVTRLNSCSGRTSEVVYRQVVVEDARDRSRSFSTESGSQAATVELLKRAANCYATSAEKLVVTLGGVQEADTVLQHILPRGLSRDCLR